MVRQARHLKPPEDRGHTGWCHMAVLRRRSMPQNSYRLACCVGWVVTWRVNRVDRLSDRCGRPLQNIRSLNQRRQQRHVAKGRQRWMQRYPCLVILVAAGLVAVPVCCPRFSV